MATRNDKPEKEEPSELHKLMGITPEQVRRELIEQGIDPEAEVEAMRRLGRVLTAKFAQQIEREAAMGHELAIPKRRGKASLESRNQNVAPIAVEDVASICVQGMVVGRADAL